MSKLSTNPILRADSYKLSHWKQYPSNTKNVFSYVEARGCSEYATNEVVHFGLQSFIQDVLLRKIDREDIMVAAKIAEKHGTPFNLDGWLAVLEQHNGYMPLRIMAVEEGAVVPLKNVTVTVEATDPDFFWLTSYIEPALLESVWYGSTVATMSRCIKKVIKKYLDRSADNPDMELPYKLHDFGFRGVSSNESAGIGGAAHLVNFMGTDTIPGMIHAIEYYAAEQPVGVSIPASEHSTMTSWGRIHEFQAYKNMVLQYAKPGAVFACVIDSYDTMNAIKLWALRQEGEDYSLLEMVSNAGAVVVLRPDSGDQVQTPIQVIESLGRFVGFHMNGKGYKVLPDYVRVIQGDGIDIRDVDDILKIMDDKKLSASNIAFGMGGGLLQKVNRDTFKFAMKCSAIQVGDEWRDVYKEPKADFGKSSKRGRLMLYKDGDGNLFTGKEWGFEAYTKMLNCVYEHGEFDNNGNYPNTSFVNFDKVRENAALK